MLFKVGIAFLLEAKTVHSPDANTDAELEFRVALVYLPLFAMEIGWPAVQSMYKCPSIVNRSLTTVTIDGPPRFKAADVCCINERFALRLSRGLYDAVTGPCVDELGFFVIGGTVLIPL